MIIVIFTKKCEKNNIILNYISNIHLLFTHNNLYNNRNKNENNKFNNEFAIKNNNNNTDFAYDFGKFYNKNGSNYSNLKEELLNQNICKLSIIFIKLSICIKL